MASYKIEWKSSAAKELQRLPKKTIVNILDRVNQLAYNPSPAGVRKLIGTEGIYRIRSGDYRIIYQVLESKLIIEIVRVGHRKDVYR